MGESWDYVIVGGGSAGTVLAARLSENPDTRVLLLEAGPDYRSAQTPREFWYRDLGIEQATPDAEVYTPSSHDQRFYWGQLTGQRNQVQSEPLPYPRGRGLGGSSTVNGLFAIRGVPADFDGWAADGATGWSFAEVLPAFKRLEDDLEFGDREYHGRGGPIPIYREPQSGWGGVDHALAESAVALGHRWSEDLNAPDVTGAFPFGINIRDDRRVSTNDAYVEPARERANLTVTGECHVDRVLFDGTRAVAVVSAAGERFDVERDGEVLLCAGAVHTPAILMRSGVGPAEVLRGLAIPSVAELPVGESLQDHAALVVDLPIEPSAGKSVGNRVCNVGLRYTSGIADGGVNDMILVSLNHNWFFGKETGGIAVQLNRVFSRGWLKIVTADPHTDPQVYLGLLDDERDLRRMEDALERIREIMAQPAFTKIATGAPSFPDPRARVTDVVHICGTCHMGAPTDDRSVVDPDCRVLGLEQLRVIDASVMPEVVRANIHLSVLMIAEEMAARMTGAGSVGATGSAGQPAEAR